MIRANERSGVAAVEGELSWLIHEYAAESQSRRSVSRMIASGHVPIMALRVSLELGFCTTVATAGTTQ